MNRAILLLAAASLALAGLALPTASANTIPCDPVKGSEFGDPTQPAEDAACAVGGIVLWVAFETVQCVVHGDSDVCILP